MPMIRAMRLLNAVEAGTTSGAQLQTLLADPGRLAEFNVLMGMRGQTRRMAASSTAMAAVIASSTAMAAVIASSTAMAAVAASSTAMTAAAASSTAMTAVWASNTATDAVFASATARLAIYNSDTALTALQATPAQVQRKVTSVALNESTSAQSFAFKPNGTKVILLRRYYSGTESDMIDWARGSATAAVGQGPAGGGRDLDTGVQALGCVSGSYTSNSAMPTANNDTGNFVSAANGLQRRARSSSTTLYVSYIVV